MVLQAGSALGSFSTDLDEARLVVMDSGDREVWYHRPRPGSKGEAKALDRDPACAAIHKWFDALPRLIDVYFAAGVAVSGVEFRDLRKGGLMLEDPADRARWKNVFFGQGCVAGGEALFSQAPKLNRNGHY